MVRATLLEKRWNGTQTQVGPNTRVVPRRVVETLALSLWRARVDYTQLNQPYWNTTKNDQFCLSVANARVKGMKSTRSALCFVKKSAFPRGQNPNTKSSVNVLKLDSETMEGIPAVPQSVLHRTKGLRFDPSDNGAVISDDQRASIIALLHHIAYNLLENSALCWVCANMPPVFCNLMSFRGYQKF